ncbi:hypothetical protein EVAR_25676_1 [Eumeta japonica]|uniref:Uncharacterized protein n=1 Tax=Eumeta variegata TaxID=151549 RepID=A0A4C1WG40_EUMVA|nr:hypothetical protein EVAR_25676_1 [Eumeta japonica]
MSDHGSGDGRGCRPAIRVDISRTDALRDDVSHPIHRTPNVGIQRNAVARPLLRSLAIEFHMHRSVYAFTDRNERHVCCARGRPIIVEWRGRKAFGGPLSRSNKQNGVIIINVDDLHDILAAGGDGRPPLTPRTKGLRDKNNASARADTGFYIGDQQCRSLGDAKRNTNERTRLMFY